MQKTPKLQLNKPDLNDYVNVSDLNENMDILDGAVSELQDGSAIIPDLETTNKTLAGGINENKKNLAAHLAEDATCAHKGTNISFSPPADMDSTNMQAAVVEAFTFGNSRKHELVDLLLSLDDSLLISYESTWQDIYTAAADISTGKKWASGNIAMANDEWNTSNKTMYTLHYNVDFDPKLILVNRRAVKHQSGGGFYNENSNQWVYSSLIQIYTPPTRTSCVLYQNTITFYQGDILDWVLYE